MSSHLGTLPFSHVPLHTTATKQFSLRNPFGTRAHLRSVSITTTGIPNSFRNRSLTDSDDCFFLTGCPSLPIFLDPHETLTFEVSFVPNVRGTSEGKFSLGFDHALHDVSLVGIGVHSHDSSSRSVSSDDDEQQMLLRNTASQCSPALNSRANATAMAKSSPRISPRTRRSEYSSRIEQRSPLPAPAPKFSSSSGGGGSNNGGNHVHYNSPARSGDQSERRRTPQTDYGYASSFARASSEKKRKMEAPRLPRQHASVSSAHHHSRTLEDLQGRHRAIVHSGNVHEENGVEVEHLDGYDEAEVEDDEQSVVDQFMSRVSPPKAVVKEYHHYHHFVPESADALETHGRHAPEESTPPHAVNPRTVASSLRSPMPSQQSSPPSAAGSLRRASTSPRSRIPETFDLSVVPRSPGSPQDLEGLVSEAVEQLHNLSTRIDQIDRGLSQWKRYVNK
eukprot:ANDGO_06660.mRNA.1 hypothetical protein